MTISKQLPFANLHWWCCLIKWNNNQKEMKWSKQLPFVNLHHWCRLFRQSKKQKELKVSQIELIEHKNKLNDPKQLPFVNLHHWCRLFRLFARRCSSTRRLTWGRRSQRLEPSPRPAVRCCSKNSENELILKDV
jgi:hypothetical protein